MGGKRPKTAKSGKSGGKSRNKKLKGAESQNALPIQDLAPPVEQIQKDCLICKCIMIEPCKLADKWFCIHCIKHSKASSAAKADDEEDDIKPPETTEGETPAITETDEKIYSELCRKAPNNPVIDLELQKKIKTDYFTEYEAQYEILAKKDLLSDAEKITIQIEVGNTYRHIDPDTAWKLNPSGGLYNKNYEHDWCCFVKMADAKNDKYLPFLLNRIAFRLHVSRRLIATDPMSKSIQVIEIAQKKFFRKAKNQEEMIIDLDFKHETGLKSKQIKHPLCFENNGLSKSHNIKMYKIQWEKITTRHHNLHGFHQVGGVIFDDIASRM